MVLLRDVFLELLEASMINRSECTIELVFSADTGCIVELVSSDSVNNRDAFNRRGDTAKGCVSGVTAGEYVVRLYD